VQESRIDSDGTLNRSRRMKRSVVRVEALLALLALALVAAPAGGAAPPKEKADPAAIARLIGQLGSDDFEAREKASRQLAALEEVPDALRRAAARGTDLEVARRARAAIAGITDRAEEKAFQAVARGLHRVELNRLVRRMATKGGAGEKEWMFIQAVAKAVLAEANKSGGRPFDLPDLAAKARPRLLLNGETRSRTSVSGSVLLSAGPTPYVTGVKNSLVIVDGDFAGATGINNSLLIVRGNVGRVTAVVDSVILATGNWEGATLCDRSFVQVNNQRIRFTGSRDSVLVRTAVRTTGPTTSRVVKTDRGPLRLLRFSPLPTDAQLVWGKAYNGLAVAITPGEQKGQFLVRWKNVGGDDLAFPWDRLNSDLGDRYFDDLLGHVYLKGPGGKLATGRKYPAPRAGGPPRLGRWVVLGPGQTHEETIDLWSYVEKPAAGGNYRLSLELDLPMGRRGLEVGAKTWSGKVQSNVLAVPVGK
jgi:hypothetical protein